ncbi:GntR family transcriptional regulator [Bifidobacterium sp. ESL0763]|uniref:GntR family transcriptional regulator n=1 Tax=Bifidobacterium sp. ESL0763 TaxID=2983227 RepID=UPI0023F68AEE|nr:GntR family transcriptional regulator [Bifidobacterium sp. ESL0763]MDF7663742.1 GntR family transcriptional regulator [Bifidobacterium sp. ESL0763]
MELIVSSVSGEPIYGQIKRQIREAVLDGELKGGQALPSLRKLARELHVSVLTVTRAYNELADEGIVVNVQGKGTFVAEKGDERMKVKLAGQVRNALRQVGEVARSADIPLIDLMAMLETAYNDAE